MRRAPTKIFTILYFPMTLCAETTAGQQDDSKDKKTPKKLVVPEYIAPPSLSSRFDRIVYHNDITIIPKGAILYLPPAHKPKINAAHKKIKKLSWHDFYIKNRNLMHIIPLTQEQAFGTKANKRYEMPYEKLEDLKKLGRIIVCTYKDIPIRVKVQPKPKK